MFCLGAYKQALVQQVAAAAKAKHAHGHSDQENQSPEAITHDSCQGAVLQLVPPTPLGTAPMQAAAMSVAAKGRQALPGGWAAPLPVEGAPCFTLECTCALQQL